MALLEIKYLQVDFMVDGTLLRAVDDICLNLDKGEVLCLVGESGSGKSVTALSIARLLPSPPARYGRGEIVLQQRNVLNLPTENLRELRGKVVGYVFQEPSAALNPVFKVGRQIKEALRLHRPENATDEDVIRLLKLVRISDAEKRINDYPFQMSGGMQQRVMLAMALAGEPQLLVADEPTTALDVTIQAQILELLREFKKSLGMAILLITHNLGIVGEFADRAAVMYAGQILELAPARELLQRPFHPYTRALLNSIPRLKSRAEKLQAIPGNVPELGNFPQGCRFFSRCPSARPECAQIMPELSEVERGRWVRCLYWKELA